MNYGSFIKLFLIFSSFALFLSCSSYNKSIRNIKENPEEVLIFKTYLEEHYNLNKIDKHETIWGTYNQTDSIIYNFCLKNNLSSIIKHPYDKDSYYYSKYGDIVQLYYNHIFLIESNQSIIFDYTEKGLENYNTSYSKYKVADRIYIFK